MKIAARFVGFLILAVFAFAGCHELGHVDGPPVFGGASFDLIGEVRYVDTRNSVIQVRSDAGRTEYVQYDRQTRVVYRQRDYAVSNLEPGDYVAMRVQQDRNGRFYTDSVTVRESAQDRGWAAAGAEISGEVISHNSQYNVIEISQRRGGRLTFVYDRGTIIRYRGPTDRNIGRGDDVTVTLRNQRDREGRPFASTITVREYPPSRGAGAVGKEISGEVISHNSQYNIIEISQGRSGSFAFVYDRGTNIQYRDPTDRNIGPGDNVTVTLRNQRDSEGRPFASAITVRDYPNRR